MPDQKNTPLKMSCQMRPSSSPSPLNATRAGAEKRKGDRQEKKEKKRHACRLSLRQIIR